MKNILLTIISVFIFLYPESIPAFETYSKGQFSTWLLLNGNPGDKTQFGFRFIPELSSMITKIAENRGIIDTEISFNANSQAYLNSPGSIKDNLEINPYRVWLRYHTNQFEARAGLQQINFGPARILRSLMWFDTLDPRDPFKLTKGVNSLLMRYYSLNNANLWLWCLYGNEGLKGLEQIKTEKDKPEYGGRWQVPVSRGEFAFSFHQRVLDPADWLNKTGNVMTDGTQKSIAFDGAWDISAAIWFELSASNIEIDSGLNQFEEHLTIGSDYTFSSGIHVLGEHYVFSSGPDTGNTKKNTELSAFSADYALSLIDSINMINLYDWLNRRLYVFAGWQKTYDKWQFNLLAFTNNSGIGAFTGNGVELIATYNY